MLTSKCLHQIKLITLGDFSIAEGSKMQNKSGKDRVFSVELKSKNNLRNVTLVNGSSDNVLIEGTLGELVQATFAEGIVLEVVGKNGVLRLDLGENDIKKTSGQEQMEV